MKKWLMIALAVTSFSLAACEDEETVTDNSVALVEDQEVVEEPVQNEIDENLRANHYKQYYKVLSEAVEDLGFAPETSTYNSDTTMTGVYYAELIDFDRDGYEELYVLMKNNGGHASKYSHRGVTNYVHEVWTPNREGDTPELGYYAEIEAAEHSASDKSVSFIEGENATFIKEFSHRMAEGMLFNDYKLMTRETGISKLTETIFAEYTEGRYVNDVLVEREEFEREMAKFDGTERPIIISEAGEKRYGFDKVGTSVILPLLEKLSGKPYEGYDSVETVNANTLVSKAPVDEQALRNAIKEALYDYSGNPKMDGVLSYYTAEEMVEMVRAHSGYEIDLNNLPFKGKDHASIQEFITYENGHFYIYPR